MFSWRKPVDEGVDIVGAGWHPLRDAYHGLLLMPWSVFLVAIASLFLGVNGFFGLGYVFVGGVHGMVEGSFSDAFMFSVQTMATIGYGAMYPETVSSQALVVAEAVVGLIFTALSTGIVFARFTQSRGQLVFSDFACISPMNGIPTLTFRIGNARSSAVVEATIRVAVFRTERTKEGVVHYRLYDAALLRDRNPALRRSWNIMHVIDESSPLWGLTPESLRGEDMEVVASVVGTDDTSLQPVHARHRYGPSQLLWGARLADVLTELPNGRLRLDLTHFHHVMPSEPTASFPYRMDPSAVPPAALVLAAPIPAAPPSQSPDSSEHSGAESGGPPRAAE